MLRSFWVPGIEKTTSSGSCHQNHTGKTSAELAWSIAPAHQRQGYATEAASAMVGWLRQHGANVFIAHIHPEHGASIGVARHLELQATDVIIDGETRWTY